MARAVYCLVVCLGSIVLPAAANAASEGVREPTANEVVLDEICNEDGVCILDDQIFHRPKPADGFTTMSDKDIYGAVQGSKWPNGDIAYSYAPGISNALKTNFKKATAMWSAVSGVCFQQRTTQANYILVTEEPGAPSCGQSFTGMRGGPQRLNIRCGGTGTVLHELGHALGLMHEHKRTDRDGWIKFYPERVKDKVKLKDGTWKATTIYLEQFAKEPASLLTTYDYCSVMHYGLAHFAKDAGKPPMEPIKPVSCTIGSFTLSQGDKEAMAKRYGPPRACKS